MSSLQDKEAIGIPVFSGTFFTFLLTVQSMESNSEVIFINNLKGVCSGVESVI